MEIKELAKCLEGLHTVDSIAKKLDINRRTAINYISLLRKNGLVETVYGKRKIRMYKVSPFKKVLLGYPGLYDTINRYSKVKIAAAYEERIHTHKLSVEEALVRAVKSRRFRTILAALGLFNKIHNWHRLYEIANKEKAGRKVGALYDTARKVIRVKRMDERTRKALRKSAMQDRFIVDNIRSKDFEYIEKEWKVYLPFNKQDLGAYKE